MYVKFKQIPTSQMPTAIQPNKLDVRGNTTSYFQPDHEEMIQLIVYCQLKGT